MIEVDEAGEWFRLNQNINRGCDYSILQDFKMFQNNRTFSAEVLKEAEGGEIPAFSVTVETGEKNTER